MNPVRIACVRYLNTLPLIEGLEKLEGVTLVPAVPSEIAQLVASGEADVGLASVVDAAGGSQGKSRPLAILPAGMIGCDGPTMTVRLFSAVPPERIRTLHADAESHTSVILCRVLLERLHGVRPEVAAFEAGGGGAWPETVLLIGDKVVTSAPPADRYPHQLDLGQVWKDWTGLPFVYAVWMCRDGESARVRAAAEVLDRQLRRNLARLDWIAARRAGEHGWPRDLAREYLGSLLRYRFGPREREAVERFLGEAADLGLVPGAGVVWANEPAGAER